MVGNGFDPVQSPEHSDGGGRRFTRRAHSVPVPPSCRDPAGNRPSRRGSLGPSYSPRARVRIGPNRTPCSAYGDRSAFVIGRQGARRLVRAQDQWSGQDQKASVRDRTAPYRQGHLGTEFPEACGASTFRRFARRARFADMRGNEPWSSTCSPPLRGPSYGRPWRDTRSFGLQSSTGTSREGCGRLHRHTTRARVTSRPESPVSTHRGVDTRATPGPLQRRGLVLTTAPELVLRGVGRVRP